MKWLLVASAGLYLFGSFRRPFFYAGLAAGLAYLAARGIALGRLPLVGPHDTLAFFSASVGLMALPFLLSSEVHPPMILFIVFYGLDWVATVPPTMALCREHFGERAPVVFGWVFASHQIGASIASILAGVVRDTMGSYTYTWFVAAGMCVVAAMLSVAIRPARDGRRELVDA